MITLKELAAKSGVSIATVSNILNGKSNVSEETKQRVLKLIEETGYRPNVMASRLRARKTRTIGLIMDELGAFSTPALVEGVLSVLEANGYKAILEDLRLYSKYQNDIDDEEYASLVHNSVDEMMAVKVDGIIYIAAHAHNISYFSEELPVPVIIAYAYQEKKIQTTVRIDDIASSFCITDYLISKGHKKIGIIGGPKDEVHVSDRFIGCKNALEKHNIKTDDSFYEQAFWDRISGKAACEKLLKRHPDITAFFCFNDLMAAGVYDYLHSIGKVPGKDIAVAGFDNREVSEYLNPQLTTMAIPLLEIGCKSAEVLLDKIDGKTLDDNDYQIACKLVERESV